MTPMVKLRLARRERAKKFGRYLYFLTAAKILSFVSCGIESATCEPLTTSETVAGERFRSAASSFKLTGLRLDCAARPDILPVFPVLTLRSLAQTETPGKHRLDYACDEQY